LTSLVCIDGELMEPAAARVPVFDRGFLYGDSVYEVVRTYLGVPFHLDRHLERLERSAAALELALPPRATLVAWLKSALRAAGNPESYARLIVTRGSGPITLDPTTADRPRTVLLVKALEPYPAWMYAQGIKVSVPAIRRNPRAALDPSVKSGNYLNNVLALGQARRAGFDDALLLDIRGRVTEGSSSNVFAVRGGSLLTPPLETGLLHGVTRALVLELAGQVGLQAHERELEVADLARADELWLTSTLREVLPVVRLDEATIGAGAPGPRYRAMAERLHAHALDWARAAAADFWREP